jgi:hypothetical protein
MTPSAPTASHTATRAASPAAAKSTCCPPQSQEGEMPPRRRTMRQFRRPPHPHGAAPGAGPRHQDAELPAEGCDAPQEAVAPRTGHCRKAADVPDHLRMPPTPVADPPVGGGGPDPSPGTQDLRPPLRCRRMLPTPHTGPPWPHAIDPARGKPDSAAGAPCDALGFQPGLLTLMIRSTELTLVKRRSTRAITSKTSPTTPNDPFGQPLVKTLLKTP